MLPFFVVSRKKKNQKSSCPTLDMFSYFLGKLKRKDSQPIFAFGRTEDAHSRKQKTAGSRGLQTIEVGDCVIFTSFDFDATTNGIKEEIR